jgi:predicted transcriptional regulator
MNQPNFITMSIAVTPELKQWLQNRASKDDRSVSYVLRKILERELRREKTWQKITDETN